MNDHNNSNNDNNDNIAKGSFAGRPRPRSDVGVTGRPGNP